MFEYRILSGKEVTRLTTKYDLDILGHREDCTRELLTMLVMHKGTWTAWIYNTHWATREYQGNPYPFNDEIIITHRDAHGLRITYYPKWREFEIRKPFLD